MLSLLGRLLEQLNLPDTPLLLDDALIKVCVEQGIRILGVSARRLGWNGR